MPDWTTNAPDAPGLYWTNKGKGIHRIKRFTFKEPNNACFCGELPWSVCVQAGFMQWPVRIEEPPSE